MFGGRVEAALRRAGRLGDGYQATSSSPAAVAARIPVLREAATAAGRPMPALAARVRVVRDGGATADATSPYTLTGTPDQIRAEIAEWEAVGVTHLALYFASVEPEAITRDVEWWTREISH